MRVSSIAASGVSSARRKRTAGNAPERTLLLPLTTSPNLRFSPMRRSKRFSPRSMTSFPGQTTSRNMPCRPPSAVRHGTDGRLSRNAPTASTQTKGSQPQRSLPPVTTPTNRNCSALPRCRKRSAKPSLTKSSAASSRSPKESPRSFRCPTSVRL